MRCLGRWWARGGSGGRSGWMVEPSSEMAPSRVDCVCACAKLLLLLLLRRDERKVYEDGSMVGWTLVGGFSFLGVRRKGVVDVGG
jgi:hypothetical protein